MLKYSLKLTGILIGLLSAASAFGASHNRQFLWKVRSADRTLYIAGIMQLLKKSDYPLPAAFGSAFKKSGTLILAGEGPGADQKKARKLIMQRGVFTQGKTLMGDLNASAQTKLKRTAKQLKIPLQKLVQFKPWYAALTIG